MEKKLFLIEKNTIMLIYKKNLLKDILLKNKIMKFC